ncbi:thioesterase II family protein [Pseudanabaena sp. FACHB-2040]|uniref:thioesterase II family protein n=1 Tax=Pseudanabaena sp. FACHB-2040 TaxID=2692859 RepID=UPI001689DAEE|nr:thioesterase II family protein [Pseudanabaena sp. FACHB-2040]MBD2256625.1 thioesterase [Pseudanabaena sp. FACHB-2040]
MGHTPWIKCFKPNPSASLRLFCFPYAGGGASVFRAWASQLPPNIEVCAIQLPGREDRIKEPLFTELRPLVQTLAPVLRPYCDIPFAFFGHSMGALISFELARYFRTLQQPAPVHLFVSGRSAPHLPDKNPFRHTLPDQAFLQALRDLNGMSLAVLNNPELLQMVLPILRADFSICETYTHQVEPPLDCSISALSGEDDLEATCDRMQSWNLQTTSTFSLTMLPGGHFFLQTNQALFLELLSRELNLLKVSSVLG